MTKSTKLFDYDLPDTSVDVIWDDTKEQLNYNIDAALDRGIADKETLEIMKELLEICKPIITMEDYMEEDHGE